MSKRRAGMELTHENWDQDQEKEEAGLFAVADSETLSKRPIIKAKRRVTAQQKKSEEEEGEPAQTPFAAFKGFSGFGAIPTASKPTGSFSFKPVSTDSSTSSTKPQPFASSLVKPVQSSFKPAAASAGTGSSLLSSSQTVEGKPTFSFKPSTVSPQSLTMFKSANQIETDSKGALFSSSNGSTSPSKAGGAANGNGGTTGALATELKALNQSVAAWIQQHVESNPVCDLTPIFDDYKKHLSEIEKKRDENKANAGVEAKTKPSSAATSNPLSSASGQEKSSSGTSSFTGFQFSGSFGKSGDEKTSESSSAAKPGFGFGSSGNQGFSFGSASSGASSTFGSTSGASLTFGSASGASSTFGSTSSGASSTFGSTKPPFSFGDMKPSSSSTKEGEAKQAEEGEPSDEPPKVEVKVVEEKDSLYSTRCKVFYKKAGEFKERGVGMLHIKDCGGSGQILVRADTSLGNVLLNIGVASSMVSHFTKQGKNKNNVMLLSPLNPPADKKCPKCNKNYVSPQESTACEGGCNPDPTPLLLRVKSEADADGIIGEIKKLFDD